MVVGLEQGATEGPRAGDDPVQGADSGIAKTEILARTPTQ